VSHRVVVHVEDQLVGSKGASSVSVGVDLVRCPSID
jgi:hypothetical protein